MIHCPFSSDRIRRMIRVSAEEGIMGQHLRPRIIEINHCGWRLWSSGQGSISCYYPRLPKSYDMEDISKRTTGAEIFSSLWHMVLASWHGASNLKYLENTQVLFKKYII